MKKNSIVFGVALIMGVFLSNSVFAQTATQNLSLKVDGSALLAVVGIGANIAVPSVSMSLAGATEAGAEVMTTIENQSTRLRVSSLVEGGLFRSISASISESLYPAGTTLSLELIKQGPFLPDPVNGGTSAGPKDITAATTTALLLVSDITTCWSGTADGDGYIIKYVFGKRDGATALVSKDITVTYTISTAI